MGFLEDYLTFTHRQESPSEFHLWAAIASLGHVLGRKVWLDRYEGGKVYPAQIMVVLVSQSAVARKSAAVDIATRFLDYLDEFDVNVLPDLGSTESILECLDRKDPTTGEPLDAVGLIVNDELGTFLSKSKYAETLLSHLNKLNTNQKAIYRIKFRSWEANLHNATVGMLAATTYTGFAEEMPQSVLAGGFMGRIITVASDQPKETPQPLTEPPPNYAKLEVKLIQQLFRVNALRGQYRFSPDGKRWFELWYTEHFNLCRNRISEDAKETGWMGRKDAHLLRVAMVLAASNGDDLVLTAQHLIAARDLIEQVEPNTKEVSREVGVRESYTQVGKRILNFLNKHGASHHTKIKRFLHRYGDKDVINRELETLVDMEVATREHRSDGVYYARRLTRGEMLQRVSGDD